ncbi:MAG TPA: glycosyltransferase, partial [Chthoniobacteraceae bacterium]|nr:glycosyltransferase [Chthoniobacteraceae bacterium]
MRIIVWGINYAPETTGIGPHNTALCEFLKARGHDVEMVTTFSYYPRWRKLPGDAGRLYHTDTINGVPVHRCWHYVPRQVSSVKRILHEATFCVTSTLRMLALKRADLVIVVSPPLLPGAAAWLCGVLKRTRFLFHAQDLQPEGALELGMLKPGMFVRALLGIEVFIYRKAWRVSGISEGMLEAFSKKGVPAAKQVYFPNTIVVPSEIPQRGLFRAKHGLKPDDFLAVHSGNVGMKHGLQQLVEAARMVRDGRV